MAFLIRKVTGAGGMWLKRAAPFVTWGPRTQAQTFESRAAALQTARGLASNEQPVVVVDDNELGPAPQGR
jgi:hypothetical protein